MLKTKTVHLPASTLFFGPSNPSHKMVQVKKIDASTRVKGVLSALAAFIAILGIVIKQALPLPGWIEFLPFQIWWFSCVIGILCIWQGVVTKKLDVYDAHTNLEDEGMKLLKTMKHVEDAKALYPESNGYMLRCEEFQRLAFEMTASLISMNSTNVGRATNATKHELINKLQNEAKNLSQSGMDLADLMAIKRAENVVSDSEFLGASHFIDDVNLEMATYRALGAGDPVEKKSEGKKSDPKGTTASTAASTKTSASASTSRPAKAQPSGAKSKTHPIDMAEVAIKQAEAILKSNEARLNELEKLAATIDLDVATDHLDLKHSIDGWKKHCSECERHRICRCIECTGPLRVLRYK